MADHSQSEFALDQGWRAIAWTRDFDTFRATIMVAQDGTCLWRVQSLTLSSDQRSGQASSLAKAHEAITRIASANPLIISGLTPLTR